MAKVSWAASCTLNLNANGGYVSQSQLQYRASGLPSSTYMYTHTFKMPTPTRDGFTFSKWSRDYVNVSRSTLTQTEASNSATATASWNENHWTVKYDANGGANAPSSQQKYYTKNLTLRTDKPTRDGYVFQGWMTSASDTAVKYQPGATYTANKAITLYALWVKAEGTITYNNGSTHASGTVPSSKTAAYGTVVTLPTAHSGMTRPNYTFAGTWHRADTTEALTSWTINGKITLYANWNATVTKLANPTVTVSPSQNLDPYTPITLTAKMADTTALSCYVVNVGSSSLEFATESTTFSTSLYFAQFSGLTYGSTYTMMVTASNDTPGDDKEFNGTTTINNLITTSTYAAPTIGVYSDEGLTKSYSDMRVPSTGKTLYFTVPNRLDGEIIQYSRNGSGWTTISSNVSTISATINSSTPNIYFRRGGNI